MLIEFRFKNFKSFQNEQTLSMVASTDKSLMNNSFNTGAFPKYRLLRSLALYGANAAGKSNVMDAFKFVEDFVCKSATNPPRAEIPVQPFLLDPESRNAPSEFEISFAYHNVRYKYGFTVDRKWVYSEWLMAYPKRYAQTWFKRTLDPKKLQYDWYFGTHLKGERTKLQILTAPATKPSNKLFLSVAATFEHLQLYNIYKWFTENLLVVNANDSYEHFENITATTAFEDSNFQNFVKRRLQYADFGIADFSVEEVRTRRNNIPRDLSPEVRLQLQQQDSKQLQLTMKHTTKSGELVTFSNQNESLGTRRYFALSTPWIASLSKGGTLFVDELDSSLHPVLVKALIAEFQHPRFNKRNAQIIFNTQDTSLLDTSFLRRDQIWFVEKDKGGASHIYSLYTFNPRKEGVAEGYLQGKYGAIPFLNEDILQGRKD